jgi:hypothetical protein
MLFQHARDFKFLNLTVLTNIISVRIPYLVYIASYLLLFPPKLLPLYLHIVISSPLLLFVKLLFFFTLLYLVKLTLEIWRNNFNNGSKGIAGSSRVAVRSIQRIGERLYPKREQQSKKKAAAAAERAQRKNNPPNDPFMHFIHWLPC